MHDGYWVIHAQHKLEVTGIVISKSIDSVESPLYINEASTSDNCHCDMVLQGSFHVLQLCSN